MIKRDIIERLGIPEEIKEIKITEAHLEAAKEEIKEFRDEIERDLNYIEDQVEKCDPGIPTEVDILRERVERSYHHNLIDNAFYTIADLSLKNSVKKFEESCICNKK